MPVPLRGGGVRRGAPYSRGWWELPFGLMGGTTFPYPGTLVRGGLAPGAVEAPFWARGEAAPPRPGGGGRGPCPGGGRGISHGPWGGIICQESGAPARGEREVQPRGRPEHSPEPTGRHHFSENRAHRPGGDGESSPGGGRSILLGLRGGIIFQKPGTPAWGGRGVQPKGWSEYPSGPAGRHHPPRTGHTGLGGTGSRAQGVVGASFQACGG